ncbi:hypothetical protein IQ03_02211 [Gemmobacter caeni]|uniref:Uncharacterized protein n=1 Tax=Gemmobacter caeni TaxID=589035 RepID=A0A2T6AY05_9RHOB|nr:hypothetical protein [Gemmobacter caeni]PTX48703.1 hypothetical protein C8N34_109213 [Gemmobacter caeni]TWI99497.1 hypothetical protein IQ03_02211 [Gemmobacter caeni]
MPDTHTTDHTALAANLRCRVAERAICDDSLTVLVPLGELRATVAEAARLRTLLARNMVFDKGSAEDAADALGGFPAVIELVEAHHAECDGEARHA